MVPLRVRAPQVFLGGGVGAAAQSIIRRSAASPSSVSDIARSRIVKQPRGGNTRPIFVGVVTAPGFLLRRTLDLFCGALLAPCPARWRVPRALGTGRPSRPSEGRDGPPLMNVDCSTEPPLHLGSLGRDAAQGMVPTVRQCVLPAAALAPFGPRWDLAASHSIPWSRHRPAVIRQRWPAAYALSLGRSARGGPPTIASRVPDFRRYPLIELGEGINHTPAELEKNGAIAIDPPPLQRRGLEPEPVGGFFGGQVDQVRHDGSPIPAARCCWGRAFPTTLEQT